MFFKSACFTFNGIASTVYGVYAGEFNSGGLQNYGFGLSGTSIIEEKIPRKDKPFFLGIDSSPLEFDFTIVKDDGSEFERAELFDLYTWLMHDYYKELISDDDTTIKFNVIFTNPQIVHVGSRKIGISFTARCDSPYAYLIEDEDIYAVTGSQSITIDMRDSNYKKLYSGVEIEFTLGASETDLSIENTDDDGRIVTFTGLNNSETIYMNNVRKELISSTTLNRFDKFNLTWFRLVPNVLNHITITGDCSITFRYSLPILI